MSGKGIVVEFVGAPGSGKTTNCNVFVKALQEANFAAHTFKDVKSFFYKSPFSIRLAILLWAFFPPAGRPFQFFRFLISARIVNFDSIYRYYKLCVFNLALKLFLTKVKSDYVILDQWIIQGLWSATIFRSGSAKSLAPRLAKFFFKIDYALYFDVDSKTASERIGGRDSNTSRFDSMGEIDRLIELKKNQQYLLDLFQQSTCTNKITYSTLNPPETNARDFLKRFDSIQ